ncbi:XRE family transcriptional regulator [Candidatus Fermentibacteria bacterium]|nr:MAG: XRE family transcriptional regulator [Candidatus Fermentibacteria bacterium]
MNTLHVGSEIRKLRETAGMSQEYLAGLVGVSRPSIANIESGKRKISADELIQFAEIFGLTLDQLVNPSLRPEIGVEEGNAAETPEESMRISIPRENYDKFREVLLYILAEIGARPNVGQTVLYKLLYFIDFDFYERYEEQLIGAVYIKNHYGPTPTHFKRLVEEMEADGSLEAVSSKYFKYRQTKYLPRRTPDLSLLSARELQMIDEVINRLGHMTASRLSDYSHGDTPWLGAEEGEKISYEMVFYRTPEYSARNYTD